MKRRRNDAVYRRPSVTMLSLSTPKTPEFFVSINTRRENLEKSKGKKNVFYFRSRRNVFCAG